MEVYKFEEGEINALEEELRRHTQDQEQEQEQRGLFEVFREYDKEDKVIRFKDFVNEIKEQRREVALVKTNIPRLDRMTEGFRGGNLITVSGMTGQGKTSLLQTFLIEFSKQEIGSLFFTYEVQPEDFFEKFGDNIPDWAYMPRKHKKTKMQWIEERIIESIAKYNTQVVMIDHLHYLLDMSELSKFGNVSLVIGSIMRNLKEIALKYNIIVFIIAHTKKVKLSFDEGLDLDAIRDSSLTVQESDFVFFIDRGRKIKENDKEAMLNVAKNRRNGKLGKIKLIYQNNQFKELSNIDTNLDLDF